MIHWRNTEFCKAILSGKKLAITLRHIAHCTPYYNLQMVYCVSQHSVSKVIPEMCRAIRSVYKVDIVKCVLTEAELRAVATRFIELWNFPHCIGAIDDKHGRIVKPTNSGFGVLQYKKYFSILLLAILDADCRFMYLDV